ncbi:MAG: hypothetical protein U9N57_09735 [Pseudomonadota bacterium]|nr:hypothetical protein [Pseudomonadota bacterium]
MRKELFTRLLNVGLRGLSMGSRLFLIFALAKILAPEEVGLFGLMLATVSFSVLVIGADYYTYAQRELLARPPEQWSFVIQHQIKAQFILYGMLLPVQILIFVFDLMDWQYAVWFFVLLIFEHIAQEMNRLLVAMHKQLLASLVLFVRQGSWVIVVIPLMYVLPEYQNLESLYIAWLTGCLSAIMLGAVVIKRSLPSWQRVKTDYNWLKKGFKVGGVFLLATICFKGILTFDRYAVEAFSSTEVLGVYVFYISMVIGAYSFLDPAVFSFLYPRMLQSYQMQDKQAYQTSFKELIVSTIAISIVLAWGIWMIMPYIISWIDKPIYSNHLDALTILISAGFIYALGYIPHYALYAMKGDKWIVSAHISALMVFFASLMLIKLASGIQSVAMALLLAFSWMGLVKTVGYIYTKQHSILLRV